MARSRAISLSLLVVVALQARAPLCGADVTRPWLRRAGSEHQYQFNDGENSWEFARERCLAQGADLAAVNDDDEKKWILAHYPTGVAANERKIIIGLYRHPTTNAWVYTDQKEMDDDVLPWESGRQSDLQQCGYLSGNTGLANTVLCEGRTIALPAARYVCERTPEQTANVISPLASQLPADLIKQLKRIAKAKEEELNQKEGIVPPKSPADEDEKTTTEQINTTEEGVLQ